MIVSLTPAQLAQMTGADLLEEVGTADLAIDGQVWRAYTSRHRRRKVPLLHLWRETEQRTIHVAGSIDGRVSDMRPVE